MQNKGFVTTFAIALTLVCLFYLSFTLVTRHYDEKTHEYAVGNATKEAKDDADSYKRLYESHYANYRDSMSTEKVWMTFSWLGIKDAGYTLKQCREKGIGLGLDLEGGMSVIVEVDVAAVLRSLGDVNNIAFTKALDEASVENSKGASSDFITIFSGIYKKNNGENKLAGVFSTKLKDQLNATDNDDKVLRILREELNVAAGNSFNILRTRIDRFGVVAPNIQKLNDRAERIMIELPGVQEPERVRKLLQGSANLEFWRTYKYEDVADGINKVEQETRLALATVNDSLASDSVVNLGFSKPLSEYLIRDHREGSASMGLVHKNDTAAVGNIVRRYAYQFPDLIHFAWGFKAVDAKETLFSLYSLRGDLVKKGAALDGDVVTSAKADQGQYGGWEVSMAMNTQGTRSWSIITGEEINSSVAIVVDGHVYSAPNISVKIDGGRSSISGNFTYEDATDLENVLKSGRMKAGVRIIQEDVVGPSLGQEAIDAGIISFILAIVILMVYMCIAYGIIPGLVANSALILNLFFTMGALAAFNAVLTLPGITGLVLTMAMAVDANVLIYERTKEELRAGKNVKTALADGYKHAFSAIFDSNLTSVITGAILIIFGTGAIQGFATTLIIGIIASFITAVFLTRIFYEFMISKGKFRNLTFSTILTKNLFVNSKINFLGMTKKVVIIVVIFFAAGFASLFYNGLNTGIDFTGGRNYLVRFDKPVNAAEVEGKLITEFEGSIVRVLTTGAGSQASEASQLRITTNYRVEDTRDIMEDSIKMKLTHALDDYLTEGKTFDQHMQSSQRVGPSIADDLKQAAFIAVILAIICMGLYILFRFRDMAFSVGTLVAVAHDAVFVILLYSLIYKFVPFSMEVDQAFIAAILTVVGYSINDKVVIFDRIRELRNTYPKRKVTEVINEALNSTLGRTLNTGLSSFLVVLCIFALGGDTIRSFTFAILIGIAVGTFSSIFIATPIAWTMLKKKQDKKGDVEVTK